MLERVADAMVTAVDAPYCAIYLMDTERGVLVPHVVRAPSTDDLAGLRERNLDPVLNSLVGEALQRQAPAVWYNAASDSPSSQEMLQAWSFKSVLAVPIQVSAKVLGIALLSTSSDERHFTADEIELVSGIANSAALAVDNAEETPAGHEAAGSAYCWAPLAQALQHLLDLIGTGATVSALQLGCYCAPERA